MHAIFPDAYLLHAFFSDAFLGENLVVEVMRTRTAAVSVSEQQNTVY
jgi:hypothetical protein